MHPPRRNTIHHILGKRILLQVDTILTLALRDQDDLKIRLPVRPVADRVVPPQPLDTMDLERQDAVIHCCRAHGLNFSC